MNAREEYTAGLRKLADILDANPDVQLPQAGQPYAGMSWVTSHEDDPKGATQRIIRAVGGKWDKREGGTDGSIMVFTSRIAGFHVEILCSREEVCTRVVTGTRTVDKEIAVKTRTIQVEEEIVEWDCGSLLRPNVRAARS